ncbi:peptide methionine sulfoxide reductase MsrA [Undibacterium sp. KW1]|uniref:peptide-methionine (S)-S-oxide reductase MsrA n=1 Tax=Undibacterium sp. KW1 TaxID=2058624 RepID=UPI001331F9A6|nr:peptide-methionine (S)-S-oxide reductase MsrA [Undibacterium sp. KW1]BBB62942.1 peptide methionine sulfoxide reductase MsrA [Undibacterium sp. KW1]
MKIANSFTALLLGIGCVAAALVFNGQVRADEAAVIIAAPVVDVPAGSAKTETAVFAGGCFWGVQGVFQHVRGVTNAVSGYAGGKAATAHYELVGSGATGHAEAVQVTYDPSQISYGKLLQIFFSVAHDPTQLNRQGPDSGTQYRSAIFPATPVQHDVAEKYITQLNASRAFRGKLATTLEADTGFFAAEAYHQNYLTLHPNEPYIAINDLPKVENLKRVMPAVYRPDPVLVRKGI